MQFKRSSLRRQHGFTLVMVMVLSACTLLILAGVLSWTSTNSTLNGRNNEYFKTVGVAEAATEKVLASIQSDYQLGGDTPVQANLASYRLKVPTPAEDPVFNNYQMTDGMGNLNRTYLEFLPPTAFRVLTAQYRGLYGYSSIYRVISNARETTSRFNISAGVWQDVETATIPLFQFAIFYNIDLEINPGPVMTVIGPVHCNQNMYLSPGAALTFQSDVTSAGTMFSSRKPGDPVAAGSGSVTFQGEHDSGVSSLNLPIGTNNTPSAVHGVVEAAPSGESITSPMGSQRIYNKADVIVTVADPASGTNPVITVTSGVINNKATVVNAATAGAGLTSEAGMIGWRGMGALAVSVALLCGCGVRWPWVSEAGETRLEGTRWQWVAGVSEGRPIAVDQPTRYTIEFLPEFRLEVRADCSRTAGPWRIRGPLVTLGPFVATRKPCAAASLGVEFLKGLRTAHGWSVRDGALFLELPEGRGDLRFAPLPTTP